MRAEQILRVEARDATHARVHVASCQPTQLQDASLDVESAWATLADRGIPALVIWGEYDWIMSRGEADRAVAIVNAKKPGSATLVVLPKTDHGLMTYASIQAAFADQSPVWDGAPARVILDWLKAR